MNKKLFTTLCIFGLTLSAMSADLTGNVTDAALGPGTGSIDLVVGGGIAPFVYSWTGPSGFTATSEDITGLDVGVYSVTVTDLYCGVATYSWFVDSVSTIGINEIPNENSIFVYPNPGNSQITVSGNGNFKNASFNLKNVAGQTVLSQSKINGISFILDISSQAKGVYFIEMINEEKVLGTKFIKN